LPRADVHQASGNTAAAQLDRLEALRWGERRKLLQDRLWNLEIRSPLDGMVIAGEGERIRGAPLKCGQTLFEIAPLDRMLVETSVPEPDYAFVRTGQELTIVLDAVDDEPRRARIERFRPRCEIREQAWVFLAETELPNPDDLLRPGMRGRATIAGPPRRLGWIFARRAWEIFCKITG